MSAIVFFEIQASEPDTAITFYQTLFGWQFSRDETVPIPYWRIQTDGIQGGLLERPAATPPNEYGTNAFVCSIAVDDIQTIADRVEALGGQVALPVFAVPGVGWQGYFVDPDGNTFGVFQAEANAGSS